ncbi:MAG: hypothetical protein QNJ12_06280 [Ilumatobacter sp.]|uniref:hypothetical protein n=1 Tax=Ilumatobacter sp. TaxID=1967498 RepID=UPI00261466FC|nr:hypothetical protein [Ilumatobacter sp.]MDJ0768380.1 hypothetical protein [Ilumatobacter sp.]
MAPTFLRSVPASAWLEAPDSLCVLGMDLPDNPQARYLRRCGDWVVWRAGPGRRGDARYWAGHRTDADRWCTFRVFPDGSGVGTTPDGQTVTRLRHWKRQLRLTR